MLEKSREALINDVNYRAFDSLYRQGVLKQRFSHLAQSKHRTLRFGLRRCGISPRGWHILDIGFGTAQTLLSFPPDNRVAGMELSDESLRLARSRAGRKGFRDADFRRPGPGNAVPFADADFDLVICSHLLEHLPDDRSMLREIGRLLAPGGFGAILIPLDQNVDGVLPREAVELDDLASLERTGQYHVRRYNDDTFRSILAEQGLAIRFAYLNEYVWDLVKGFFRRRLHRRIPLLGPACSAGFNIGLSVAPHACVRGLDRLCKLAGRRPRQGLYIVQRVAANG